jgi:cytochrome d ubiquinol oxidase subunit I
MADFDAELLSRIQFAFVISFHIIFPAFTIGLAAWLATIETAHFITGKPVYRRVFEFWLRVLSIAFGTGVVTGIVMAFQFGTNWAGLAERAGSIQGPLLGYETFTAFLLEATFLGVVLFARTGFHPGSIFSPAFASRSGRCSRPSGSSPTIAGCRSRSATSSSTAVSSPTIG